MLNNNRDVDFRLSSLKVMYRKLKVTYGIHPYSRKKNPTNILTIFQKL
jgi:hypothetical protein